MLRILADRKMLVSPKRSSDSGTPARLKTLFLLGDSKFNILIRTVSGTSSLDSFYMVERCIMKL